jgi:hypothetical protein
MNNNGPTSNTANQWACKAPLHLMGSTDTMRAPQYGQTGKRVKAPALPRENALLGRVALPQRDKRKSREDNRVHHWGYGRDYGRHPYAERH